MAGRRAPTSLPAEEPAITVTEVAVAFWKHAQEYYAKSPHTLDHFHRTLRELLKLYGPVSVSEFGPRALKTLRAGLVARGHARRYVNETIRRVKQVFRWAASEELIPVEVVTRLDTVRGLAKGRSKARETQPIKPVDDADVERTLAAPSRAWSPTWSGSSV